MIFLFWWIAQPQRYWINIIPYGIWKIDFAEKNERTLRFTIAKVETIFENMYILGKDF